jgi:predicted MPP superfamily phosphohydrolase
MQVDHIKIVLNDPPASSKEPAVKGGVSTVIDPASNVSLPASIITTIQSEEVLKALANKIATVKANKSGILPATAIFEVANKSMEKRNANAFQFIREAINIAPVYYCFGNHEIYYSHAMKENNRIPDEKMAKEYISRISDMGVNIINDKFTELSLKNDKNIFIGGLVCGKDKDPAQKIEFDSSFLERYANVAGFKILLCHYPHYYEKYLKDADFYLIFSGHAHGGHWRFFNRGVYAPHQGIFPKYTFGIHDGRLIISTGAVNNSKPIPRFFNPTEILKITILGNKEMQ